MSVGIIEVTVQDSETLLLRRNADPAVIFRGAGAGMYIVTETAAPYLPGMPQLLIQRTPRLVLVANGRSQSIPPAIVMRARFAREMTSEGWVRHNACTDMLRHVHLLYLQLAPQTPLFILHANQLLSLSSACLVQSPALASYHLYLYDHRHTYKHGLGNEFTTPTD